VLPIACDKVAVRKVLTELLDRALGKLRQAVSNAEFDRTRAVWDAVRGMLFVRTARLRTATSCS
jgi:hypothetical protein